MKVNFEFDISDPKDQAVFQQLMQGVLGQRTASPAIPAEEPQRPEPQAPKSSVPPPPPRRAAAAPGTVPPPPSRATPPQPAAPSEPARQPEPPGTEVGKANGEEPQDLGDQLRAALHEYSTMTNAVTVATFLRKELGYPNISSIPQDKYQECLEKTQERIAAAAMQ